MKRKMILAMIMAVLLTVLGVSAYALWSGHAQRTNEDREFERLNRETLLTEATPDEAETTAPETKPTGIPTEKEDAQRFSQLSGSTTYNNPGQDSSAVMYRHDFTALSSLNSDCVGWVRIPDTGIDYPVMHTPDEPEKYLNKNFYGDYSLSGVPFLDSRCTVYNTNMIIYGHNMSSGTMFAPLNSYANQSFAKAHPVIEVETAQGVKKYRVYAAAKVKSSDLWYNLTDAPNAAFFHQKVNALNKKALYKIGAAPKYGQQLVTLSTCTNAGRDDRIIVVGIQM